MKGTYLFFCKQKHMLRKTELHLTNLVDCTSRYIQNFVVLIAGSMYNGYQTLVPGINSIVIERIWVPLSRSSFCGMYTRLIHEMVVGYGGFSEQKVVSRNGKNCLFVKKILLGGNEIIFGGHKNHQI